jgi:hypothetical protein
MIRPSYTWEDDGFLLFQSAVPYDLNRRIVVGLAMMLSHPQHDLFEEVPVATAIATDPLIRGAVRTRQGVV